MTLFFDRPDDSMVPMLLARHYGAMSSLHGKNIVARVRGGAGSTLVQRIETRDAAWGILNEERRR